MELLGVLGVGVQDGFGLLMPFGHGVVVGCHVRKRVELRLQVIWFAYFY